MIKVLVAVFAVLGVAGFVYSAYAVTLLSAIMAIFMYYAEQMFERQDRIYKDSHSQAKSPPEVNKALEDKECECTGNGPRV